MANKKTDTTSKKSKSRAATRNELRLAAESRTALSVTVAWTLCLMSTLAAEAIGFCCQAYTQFVANHRVVEVLGAVMLFVALVAGLVTLVLTPFATRLAKTRPPLVLVQLAYIAGVLPMVALVLQYLMEHRP